MITVLGSLSLAVALPGAAVAADAGVSGINGALPDIQARIDALTAFAPSPISFTADIATANAIIASINATITAGLSPPDIASQIAQIAALLAELTAIATAVQTSLNLIIAFQAELATGGVAGYAFDGAQNVLGSELATALGGSTAHANAVILVTQSPSTWLAMQAIFKTS
jgi:hypothetical protein